MDQHRWGVHLLALLASLADTPPLEQLVQTAVMEKSLSLAVHRALSVLQDAMRLVTPPAQRVLTGRPRAWGDRPVRTVLLELSVLAAPPAPPALMAARVQQGLLYVLTAARESTALVVQHAQSVQMDAMLLLVVLLVRRV